MGRAYSAASIAFFLFFLTAFAQAGEVETNTSSNPTLWPIIVMLVAVATANGIHATKTSNRPALFFALVALILMGFIEAFTDTGFLIWASGIVVMISGTLVSFERKNNIDGAHTSKPVTIIYIVASGVFYVALGNALLKYI